MDIIQMAAEWLGYLFRLGVDNFLLLGAVAVVVFGVLFVRRWPDAATFAFLRVGLRAGDHVDTYRRELATGLIDHGRRRQLAVTDHLLKLHAARLENERIDQLIRTQPSLVREVGLALQAVEFEYLRSLGVLRSEKAREALRLATEKRINDLLRTLQIEATSTLFEVPGEHRPMGKRQR